MVETLRSFQYITGHILNSFSDKEFEINPALKTYVSELSSYIGSKQKITNEEFESFKNRKSYKDAVAAQNELSNKKSITQSTSDSEQLKRIDALASEYYNYQKTYGYLPNTSTNLENSSVASTFSPISILASIGISHTEASLAARLVTLGGIAAIDGPLPVGDFIALVTGAYVISSYALEYITAQPRTALPANIGSNEGSQFAPIVVTALNIVALVRDARNNGWEHFAATRYWGEGGGIQINQQITGFTAIERAKTGSDTFSISFVLANSVANSAGLGIPVPHQAHNVDNRYPNNLPHVHPTYVGGTLMAAHCFHPKF